MAEGPNAAVLSEGIPWEKPLTVKGPGVLRMDPLGESLSLRQSPTYS